MRTLWRVALALVVLLLGAYAALPVLSALPVFQRWIGARIEQATAWQVRFAQFRIHYDLSATLASLSLAQPGRPPFLTADAVQISFRPAGLLGGQPLRVRVAAPHVHTAELPAHSAMGGRVGTGVLEHAEIVDAFVHLPGADQATAIGPLSLAIDGVQGAPDQLVLNGHGELPNDAGTAAWTAELGATLATTHGSVSVDSRAPIDAVRAWIAAPPPAPLTPTSATVRLAWRGLEDGTIALDLDGAVRIPISPDAVRLTGSGAIDPAHRATRLTLLGSQWAFRSSDASRAANGVDLRIELTAQPSDTGLRGDVELHLPAGELLWDRFYVDLKHHRLTMRGRVETEPTLWRVQRATVTIDGIGTVAGSGTYDLARQQERWRAELDLSGLAAAYEVAVRDPLQADFPLLSRIALRGRIAGVIEQQRLRSGARRVTGFLDLVGVTASASDPRIDVGGLDVHLPLDLSAEHSIGTDTERGLIRIRDLHVGNADIGVVALPLRVTRNQIALAESVRIAMLGGALEIAELQATRVMGPDPQARLGLAVHDLDLGDVSRAAGWPPLTGRMMGAMPAVTIDRHAARSEGEIRMDVLGGTVRLRNLRVEELFSRVPTVRLDLDFADVSLAQLTRTFEVGRISGVAAGGVRDLEIANGQAARFDAWMETVARPGEPQRISVAAIRQLSILGGAGGDPLSLGVLGFFDEYRYAKMGFRCSLENDQFVLRGVEESNGAEYLVVGTTLPPRVNVISHTRVISFSELLRRLSRVTALTDGAQRSTSDDAAAPAGAAPE